MTAQRIVHLAIFGRVQGVGFRAWAAGSALRLGLTGWVRNRRDGSVEAVMAGPPEAIAAMVERCHHGPPGARVTGVVARETDDAALAPVRTGERVSVLGTV